MVRRKPDALFWIMAILSVPCLVAASLLDATCFFEISYELRLLVAMGYVLFAWPLLLSLQGRVVIGSALLWMLVILPQVRWNYVKAFYVDARRLSVGMEATEVRAIMEPYLELGATYLPTSEEQKWLPLPPDPRYAMIFIHSAIGWTDHCEVRLDAGGKVRNIHIEKD